MSAAEKRLLAQGIETVETATRVPGVRPELVTRFHWRARRRARRLNAARIFPSYRYEVHQYEDGRRWAVVCMQNVARKVGS